MLSKHPIECLCDACACALLNLTAAYYAEAREHYAKGRLVAAARVQERAELVSSLDRMIFERAE